MSLQEILCQEGAVEIFQQAFRNGRLGHCYIFAGEDGVGRFLTAKALAKTLLCEQPVQTENGNTDSCECCRSCTLINNDSHPDLKHIYKELSEYLSDASKRKKDPSRLGIQVIREFLVDIVGSKPQMSEKCVYIVSEAEKMNAAAQNAMLKTLEEPPGYCLIILLCTRTDRLLPTILSRAQVVRFSPIDEEVIISKLAEKTVDRDQALFWARFTNGSLGQSLMYAEMASELDFYSIKCELLEKIAGAQLKNSIEVAEWIVARNADIADAFSKHFPGAGKSDLKRRGQKLILKMILTAAVDAVHYAVNPDRSIINSSQTKAIDAISSRLGVHSSAKFVEKANSSMQWVDAYVNEKLIFEEILLHFTKLKNTD